MAKVSHTPADLSAQRLAAQQRLLKQQTEDALQTRATTTGASDTVKISSGKSDDKAAATGGATTALTGETSASGAGTTAAPAGGSATATATPGSTATPGETAETAEASASPTAGATSAAATPAAPTTPFEAGGAGATLSSDGSSSGDPGTGAPPADGGSGTPPPTGPTPPSSVEALMAEQRRLQEEQEVHKILIQMMADRRKAMMDQWKIIQDMQNACYGIITGVVASRAQTTHNNFVKWWQYITDSK